MERNKAGWNETTHPKFRRCLDRSRSYRNGPKEVLITGITKDSVPSIEEVVVQMFNRELMENSVKLFLSNRGAWLTIIEYLENKGCGDFGQIKLWRAVRSVRKKK